MTREKVTDVQGRRWVSGDLDTDAYFADVERRARAEAARSVARRLATAAARPAQRPATAR